MVGSDGVSTIQNLDLEEYDVKFLSDGKLDIDGAMIPVHQHCYNQKGNAILHFKRKPNE